jgi:hypothetical protein
LNLLNKIEKRTFPRGVKKLVAEREKEKTCHEKLDYYRDRYHRDALCVSYATELL